MQKLKTILTLSALAFLVSACNDVQKSGNQNKQEEESQQMVAYEKDRLIEKLASLKRGIDEKVVEVEGDLMEADAGELADLKKINARLIEQKAVLENKLFQLRNTDNPDDWESVRESTQMVIDSVSENIEKYKDQ
jgi:hypothetical protein